MRATRKEVSSVEKDLVYGKKESAYRPWSYLRIWFLDFFLFMDINVISVVGSVNGSINKGINEVKDYLTWIDDEYPGVSEVKDFD